MAFMVMYVLDKLDLLADMLQAWEQTGATGITIFNSTGIQRLRTSRLREDLPLMPSIGDILAHNESTNHRTLLAVVKTEPEVDDIVQATRELVGDFDQPNTGVLMVIPVTAYGLDKVPYKGPTTKH